MKSVKFFQHRQTMYVRNLYISLRGLNCNSRQIAGLQNWHELCRNFIHYPYFSHREICMQTSLKAWISTAALLVSLILPGAAMALPSIGEPSCGSTPLGGITYFFVQCSASGNGLSDTLSGNGSVLLSGVFGNSATLDITIQPTVLYLHFQVAGSDLGSIISPSSLSLSLLFADGSSSSPIGVDIVDSLSNPFDVRFQTTPAAGTRIQGFALGFDCDDGSLGTDCMKTWTLNSLTVDWQVGCGPCDPANFQSGIQVGRLASVPEPASLVLLGFGLFGLAVHRRKR
jgi:hypothetical protein